MCTNTNARRRAIVVNNHSLFGSRHRQGQLDGLLITGRKRLLDIFGNALAKSVCFDLINGPPRRGFRRRHHHPKGGLSSRFATEYKVAWLTKFPPRAGNFTKGQRLRGRSDTVQVAKLAGTTIARGLQNKWVKNWVDVPTRIKTAPYSIKVCKDWIKSGFFTASISINCWEQQPSKTKLLRAWLCSGGAGSPWPFSWEGVSNRSYYAKKILWLCVNVRK